MDIRTILKNFAKISRERGVIAAIRSLATRALTRIREMRYGIQTEGVVPLSELGLDGLGRSEYGPSDYSDFKSLMECIHIEPGKDVFLDFGAGLGRAVVLAATYPFKQVIGVELAEQLSVSARRNINNARKGFRCSDVEIVTCDATTYQVPLDVTMIYFNNPFYGAVLDIVLNNIQNSLTVRPRAISLICNFPVPCPADGQVRSKTWLALQNEIALPSGRQGLIFQAKENSLHLTTAREAAK